MRTFLACVAVLALASGARAQNETICPDAFTQAELNLCARGLYEEADAELNRAYRDLMRSVEVGPGEDERWQAYDRRQRQRHRDAQRAWIPFRDAHCETVAAQYEGGSMEPMVRVLCLARATRERTAQLRALLAPLGG